MGSDILFEHDAAKYKVDISAADLNVIVLPNRRVLEAESWSDENPPRPTGLKEVEHNYHNIEPVSIAILMNGVVATRA